MGKICAAYIRVSTHDQEEYSPDSQIRLVRDYAGKNGMELPDAFIFRDDGISGRTAEKRPGFMRMIATAKQKPRPFECILVWKFSRFARNQEESIVYKSLLKKENGIDVISISEPLMDGPFGGLIERIIEWFDAFYSANLGTEVRRGMAERASRGQPVSAAPLGYRYRDKALAVVPGEADVVRMVFRDFLAGGSLIGIAKKLNAMGIKTKRGKSWENRTVRYILTNPTYTGKLRWSPAGPNDYHSSTVREGTLLVEGMHEPIIPQEDFDAAQERIQAYLQRYKGASGRQQRESNTHMLQGLVRCGSCGATLTYTGKGMNCSQYVHGRCKDSHFVPREKLEALVAAVMGEQMRTLDFELTTRQSLPLQGERERLEGQLKMEQGILVRYKDAYAAGVDSLEEYKQNKEACGKRIAALRDALAGLEPPPPPGRERFAGYCRDILRLLGGDALSPGEKNELLRGVVDHIVFYREKREIEIVYYM